MKKALLVGITAVGAILFTAPAAAGSTATITGGDTIKITATPSQTNRILVTYSQATDLYTVKDDASTITASGLCAAVDAHTVTCPGAGIKTIDANAGRRDDTLELDRATIPTAIEGKLNGGSGRDAIRGANGADSVKGGRGNDLLNGNDGADEIEGGSGADALAYPPERTTALTVTIGSGRDDDGNELDQTGSRRDDVHGDIEVLTGAAGPDTLIGDGTGEALIGGDGPDSLFGERGNDVLRGDAGDDILKGDTGNDLARGSLGNDRLLGGPDGDRLLGGAGNDFIRGKKGADVMKGKSGNDRINAKDGTRDIKIKCGPGNNSQESAKRDKKLDPKPRSC
jgi:Ca2+-binding RTX toxin-like protein